MLNYRKTKNLFADYGISKPQKSVDPRARRLELEKEFFDAADNLVRKTKALEEIKRDKLYRQVCETWDEYCDQILHRSVSAVRLAFKSFEISEKLAPATLISGELKSSQNDEPVLSEKDLRKMARLPDREVEELLDVDLPDLPEKIAAKTKAKKAKTTPAKPADTSSVRNRYTMIKTPDLCDENKARIEKARGNIGFQKALKEWLDDSAI